MRLTVCLGFRGARRILKEFLFSEGGSTTQTLNSKLYSLGLGSWV